MNGTSFATGERKIIVGIDFGTTYSGIAWAETKRPDVLSTVTTWPVFTTNQEGASSEKVPSKLCFAANGTQWGFSIGPNASTSNEVVEWWKLDLEPSMERLEQSKDNTVARADKTAVQFSKDYLGLLVNHLLYILKRKLGDGILSSVPLEFVLTVPAIWSDAAKDTTRLALLEAPAMKSLGNVIHLVSEPEAAAMYSLSKLSILTDSKSEMELSSLMLAEALLEVEEAASGSGGLCGSTFLNKRFENFLRAKLGSQEGFDGDVVAEAVEAFETKIKRLFSTQTDLNEKFLVPVGGLANNPALGVARNRFSMTTMDLINIFDPVVSEVPQLVQEQIKAASSKTRIKAILLVGGFGASVYLREKLHQALSSRIQVLQPAHAWQAVVNGAVLKGLANDDPGTAEVNVRSRQARHSYGLEMHYKYEHESYYHLNHTKWYSNRHGEHRVNKMNWFVGRGDRLSEDDPIPIAVCKNHFAVRDGRPDFCSVDVYYDKSKRVPTRLAMQRDDQIVHVATLRADLSAIPKKDFTRFQGADNRWYFSVDITVQAIFQSASIVFSLWHKGRQYHTVTCEYH